MFVGVVRGIPAPINPSIVLNRLASARLIKKGAVNRVFEIESVGGAVLILDFRETFCDPSRPWSVRRVGPGGKARTRERDPLRECSERERGAW